MRNFDASNIRMLTLIVALALLAPPLAEAAGQAKVKVCHLPPGDPDNFHTITVGENALAAHLAHGDLAGTCFENCEVLCDDGNPCTIDACDPGSEVCLIDHPAVNCDDSDACTTDTCDPASGCVASPIACDDNSACTVDACIAGACTFAEIDCGAWGVCDDVEGCLYPCDGITCQPLDQCHNAGNCTVVGGDGVCDDPVKEDGTPCDDGNAWTFDDKCVDGTCSGFEGYIITNVMDDNGEWTLGNTSNPFKTATAGITPTAGEHTMHFNNAMEVSSGTNSIVFADLLSVGTYVATLDVGDYDNAPFAQLGNIGMTAGGVPLTPTNSSTPTPSSGAWETWNLTYTVTAADPNLGSAIGFSITVPQLTYYDNRNVAFDNLEISFVPGP